VVSGTRSSRAGPGRHGRERRHPARHDHAASRLPDRRGGLALASRLGLPDPDLDRRSRDVDRRDCQLRAAGRARPVRAHEPARGQLHPVAWTGSTGYVHEVWPGSLYSSGAIPVPVNGSAPTATADFALEQGRTISGHVYLGLERLPGANVNGGSKGVLFDCGATPMPTASTRSGLPQGTFPPARAGGTSPANQPYAGERYDNRSSSTRATTWSSGHLRGEHRLLGRGGQTIQAPSASMPTIPATCEPGSRACRSESA